ncbi:MAG: hypothetical protein M3Y08_15235 [Fibrobacterota bacterium]|nr:hypothetical protein [Fibrobacterota bacterium]
MDALFPVPVIFVGTDAALAAHLEACYAGISWGAEYRVTPRFEAQSPRNWRASVPEKGAGMVFVEITKTGTQDDSDLIRLISGSNPSLQMVLLADDDVDYFQIATDFRIGNVIKKTRFDAAVISALTIRLVTGNIFGFAPYFPDGYTVGPLYRTFTGRVSIEKVIGECFEACKPHVNPVELSSFRIFIHELLINTFSYAIEGISPEDRDTKLLRPPSEVDIAERRGIKVSLVTDHEKVGVSVMDSTGSLSMLRVLQKLRRQSKIGGEKMPPGIWDESGRGMSMVYRYSRFIVNILKDVRTETIFLQYHEQELNRFESIIITEVNPF